MTVLFIVIEVGPLRFLQEQLDVLTQSPPTIPSWYMLTALLNTCMDLHFIALKIKKKAIQ